MRVLCVMLAPIIVGTGVAMVNLASMGMAPNDILSVCPSAAWSASVRCCRLC